MKVIGYSTKKSLLKIMIILGIILVVEIIVFIIYKNYYKKDECDKYIDKGYNDLLVLDDGYITIGHNDYNGTEDAKYKDGIILSQGEITKLDKNLNIVWSTSYYLDCDVDLVGITKINDGYIVIGTEKVKLDNNDDDYTGLILKVDKEGQIVDSIQYDLLDNTILKKIVRDNNTNIIIGSSQYELDRIGNHLGGGIILKVDDNLKIIEQNNYGGNKSGEFNNIFILKDSYLVTGTDADYPIIIKFNKNFNREENDNELISKKVTYSKTLDKSIKFEPKYYNDNKLYDIPYYYELNSNEPVLYDEKGILNNKIILLIDKDYIYACDKNKLYIYDHNFELVSEDTVDTEYIKEVILNNKDIIIIGNKYIKCEIFSEIKVLTRQ